MTTSPARTRLRIAVRAYAHRSMISQKRPASYKRRPLAQASEWTLVFDTETQTDISQQLRVGAYRVYRDNELQEAGLFFNPLSLSAEEQRLVESYAADRWLRVLNAENFIGDVFYGIGYDLRASIVGFNLPFDLSRLAIDHDSARGNSFRGGFSFLLQRDRPRIQVKHLSARSALKRFTAPRKQRDGRGMRRRGIKTPVRRGYFVDVKTLAAALTACSHSLASLANHLQTPHRKATTENHGGELTTKYLDYACTDVLVTWECFQVLRDRYHSYGLTETPLHQIFSEASLGKAYLKAMGVRPWREVQSDVPPELLGIIMSTYYGGRAEVHIRREIVRVLYCDFLSMYPTVCTVMGLWRFTISQGLDWEDDTENMRDLLAGITLTDLQRPEIWQKFAVLVQVQPDDDILPIRARYDDSAWTIGLNHLTSDQPLWYTLADCIAAKILSGKTPHVVKALRFAPQLPQSRLNRVRIAGLEAFEIHPEHDDFYRRLIDLRSEVKDKLKQAKGNEAEQLDAQQLTLKITANATSYGIFVELNVNELADSETVTCHGAGETGFPAKTRNIEEPGRYFHPLLATLITGAARLMLALAERKTLDAGLDWAFCDTDSLALARPKGMDDCEFLARATGVTDWFTALNPYSKKGALFKIEEVNDPLDDEARPSKQQQALYCLAVSAKRYVLFNLDPGQRPTIRKASGHGLGHLRPPYDEKTAPASVPSPPVPLKQIGVERWQHDLWYQIIVSTLANHPDQVDLSYHAALEQPAVSRYAATTPALLRWFGTFNEGKPYHQQVKPFNFLLMFQPSKEAWAEASALGDEAGGPNAMPSAVAPYHEDFDDCRVTLLRPKHGQAGAGPPVEDLQAGAGAVPPACGSQVREWRLP